MKSFLRKPTNNPLHDLITLEKEVREFGFDWPDQETIINQALSESEEIREAIINQEAHERIQEEIGDLLHTAVSLCVFSGYDTEKTIANIVQKFSARMQAVKELAEKQGLSNLKGQSFDFMLELWKEAKTTVNK